MKHLDWNTLFDWITILLWATVGLHRLTLATFFVRLTFFTFGWQLCQGLWLSLQPLEPHWTVSLQERDGSWKQGDHILNTPNWISMWMVVSDASPQALPFPSKFQHLHRTTHQTQQSPHSIFESSYCTCLSLGPLIQQSCHTLWHDVKDKVMGAGKELLSAESWKMLNMFFVARKDPMKAKEPPSFFHRCSFPSFSQYLTTPAMYDLKPAICTTLFGTSYDGGWLQHVYM